MSFEDIIKAVYPPELKIVTGAARDRLLEAKKAQDYYNGKFWNYVDAEGIDNMFHKAVTDYFQKATGEDVEIKKSELEIQYPKFFIDELASWMFENPIQFQGESEDERTAVMKVHKDNMLDQAWLEAATESNLTHGIAVKVLWHETAGLRVVPRPSRECFPVMNADDSRLMESVSFAAMQDDEEHVWKQTFDIRYIPEFGKNACWVYEAIYNLKSLRGGTKPIPEKELKNNPLFSGTEVIDFIPVVIIPNEPRLGDVWGKSDLDPLYDLINELCKKYSSFADCLEYEMFPINVFMNVDWSQTKEPTIGPGAFLDLKGGDPEHPIGASKLESRMSAKDSVEWFTNQLVNDLHKFSKIPNITRDKLDSLGPISGVALELMYASVIGKTNRKKIYWVPGLDKVYDYVLRSLAVYEGFSYREDYDLRVEMRSKLPTNETEEYELLAKRVADLTLKTTDAMKSLGIPDPDKYLVDLLKEKAMINEAVDPDIYGAAIKREAGEDDTE